MPAADWMGMGAGEGEGEGCRFVLAGERNGALLLPGSSSSISLTPRGGPMPPLLLLLLWADWAVAMAARGARNGVLTASSGCAAGPASGEARRGDAAADTATGVEEQAGEGEGASRAAPACCRCCCRSLRASSGIAPCTAATSSCCTASSRLARMPGALRLDALIIMPSSCSSSSSATSSLSSNSS